MSYSWNKWKQGLVVALLSGLFTGVIGLQLNMSARNIVVMLLVNVAKDGLLFLSNHPVEGVDKPEPPAPPSNP